MSVITTDDLLSRIRGKLGDSDEDISLLEDATDTIAALTETEDWKSKYEENDASWRHRYKERFENASPAPNTDPETETEQNLLTYASLFTEG